MIGGKLNDAIKGEADGASGAYAVRTKKGHGVVYVGESHVGRMWRTLLRHFQAPDSFREMGRSSFATKHPEDYEVALRVTSRGKRRKDAADQAAMKAQAEWIEEFRKRGHKLHNVDDGLAAAKPGEPFELVQAPEEDFADWVRSNPPRSLVELGKLTRLVWSKPGSSVQFLAEWSLRDAPALAYDDAGKLWIVYTGRVVRGSTPEEVRAYRRTHWGVRPLGKVRDGGIAVAPFVVLGRAESITYTTQKGTDRALTDYVHRFGEGARGKWEAPRVVEHACKGGCAKGCRAAGAIALAGGTYRVDTRGIVG